MNPQSSAETVGFVVGVIVTSVIFIVPLILNLVSLGKPSTSKKCALAIIILLGSWLLSSLGIMALKQMAPNPVVMMIPGLLALCGIIASTILAIIGLVEFRAQHCRHGRKRAITALVLNGLFAAFLVGGIVMGLRGRGANRGPQAIGTAGQTVTSEPWNFRITPPPGWSTIDGGKINPLARAMFLHSQPELFTMVIAEEMPGVALENDAMLEIVKAGLRSKGEVKFTAEGRESAHGLDGLRLESDMHMGSLHFVFEHWIVQSRGFLYQLVTWGKGDAPELVRDASRRFRESFEILDPKRAAAVSPGQSSAAFRSPAFGYSIDPAGTAWKRRWETLTKDSSFAEFGVQTASQQGCFYIIPIWTGEPEPDLDALTTAFCNRIGIDLRDQARDSRKDCTQGPLRGRAFTCERSVEGLDLDYRVRILCGRGFAYALAAWRDRKIETRPEVLDEILDRVIFDAEAPATRDLAQLSERDRHTHSLVWNDLGLAYDQTGQPASALPWFQRAFEAEKRDATMLGNYMETALKLGKAAESLAYIDRHLDKFPGHQKLAFKRANAQFISGDEEGGLKSFAAVFDSGFHDDKTFADFIGELAERGRGDAAFAAIDRYAGDKPTPALSRLRASVFQARHEFDKALEILTALQTAAPNDTETTLALADCLFAAERHTAALAECEKLIAANHDSAYVWRRKGFIEYSLKRYREAKVSFEKAHEKDPPNAEIKRMLDHVSGMLGEGGNSLVKKPIEPVPVPAALLADPPADKAGAYLRGFSAYYVRAVRAIAFAKGTELKTTERVSIRVLDAQGVEKFSTLEIGFDPLSEEIFVNSLFVKNAAGEVVATGRVEDSYVVDDGTGETATQRKNLHLPVPGLQPGFTLEYTVTRRDTGPAESFRYRTQQFARALPALRSALHVVASRDALKWEGTPGLPAPKTENGTLTWIVEQPPVYRYEPMQAPAETFLPMLWLSDAHANWTTEAKDYLTQIKDRLAIDPSVRTAAAEATKGLAKEPEKIAALARFVQRELTYKAIEFGRRARVPATAAQTLRNKYGDCKDHALLLAQLLESAGIRAHLALVSFSDALRPALPSLDQFDHMIVFLPAGKGGTFLDCTGKSGDLRTGPPSGLATRQALILDPEHPRLETISDYAAGSSGVLATRDISFTTESDLEVRESVTFTGYSASGMRSSLQAVEAANRNRWLLQTMTRELPSVDLREAQIENVDDPQAPLLLKLRYLVPRRFQTAGGQLVGQLPTVWERWFLTGDPVEQRQTPFKVWIPASLESHVTVTPPPGWQAAAAKERKLDRPFCTGTASSQLEARKLHLNTQVTQHSGQFPAGEYRAYLDATSTALGLVEQGMVFKKDGK